MESQTVGGRFGDDGPLSSSDAQPNEMRTHNNRNAARQAVAYMGCLRGRFWSIPPLRMIELGVLDPNEQGRRQATMNNTVTPHEGSQEAVADGAALSL